VVIINYFSLLLPIFLDSLSAFGTNSWDIPIIGDLDETDISKFGVLGNGYQYIDWNGNGAWYTVDAQHIGYFEENSGDIAIA
jgi:hypothetical protein